MNPAISRCYSSDPPASIISKIRGYNLEFTQIDKGPFAVEAAQIELGGVLLGAVQYLRSVIHVGEPPSRKISFAVGMSRLPARWHGHDFGPCDLVCPTSDEIDLVTPAGYGIANASFPLRDRYQRIVDHCGPVACANLRCRHRICSNRAKASGGNSAGSVRPHSCMLR